MVLTGPPCWTEEQVDKARCQQDAELPTGLEMMGEGDRKNPKSYDGQNDRAAQRGGVDTRGVPGESKFFWRETG